MTRPRRVEPNATYLVTRRCRQRRFLLRASARTNQVIGFCLARAAQRTGVLVHGLCAMSDHIHLVVTDPDARLPEFLHWFFLHVSKSLNALHGEWENLWAAGRPSVVKLLDSGAILDRLVYCSANAVVAGLVARADEWPGLVTVPADYGAAPPKSFDRPAKPFRETGPVPEAAVLELTVPACFEDLGVAGFSDLFADHLARREAEARTDMERAGRNFHGAEAVRAHGRHDKPRTVEPHRRLDPTVAAADPELRSRELLANAAFFAEYRTARELWCRGRRGVVFPAGTYLLHRDHRVRCRPHPPPVAAAA